MKMKNYFICIFLATITLNSYSQENSSEKKNAFAISFGSPGLGIEYARKLSSKLNAKVVWHSFKLEDYEQEDIEIKNDLVDLLANLELSIVDIGIEYLPFKNSSFKLTTGVGIINNANLNSIFTYKEEVVVGDVIITNENVGEIAANVAWSGIAPYVGIGFGRAIPKKRLGFGIEFGTYFTSSPEVDLTATNLLSSTASQEENIQESLESYNFIPKISIRLAYNF